MRRAPALAAVAAGLAACAIPRPVPGGLPAPVGTYRAEIEPGDGRAIRFRLLLWVEAPGRLHAEVVSPTGSAFLIVDAGGGRIAVSLPQERSCYAGAAGPETIGELLGIPMSVEDLVRAVLDGGLPQGAETAIERVPPRGDGLPESISFESGGRALRLSRRAIRSGALAPGTGSGSPPPGCDALPLEGLNVGDLLDGASKAK